MTTNFFYPSQPSTSNKFNLYLKVREIKQVSLYLKNLSIQPLKKRKVWLEENEELVNQLLDSFTNDSLMSLEGVALEDEESLNLSMDLMMSLRETVNMLNNLSIKEKRLRS